MKLETLNKTIFENIHHSNGEFSKHFHNTYTIGLTHDGIFKSRYEKKIIYSYKQSSKIINPGEVHSGDSNSWKYTNFYPSIELVSEVYEQIFFEKKIPIFAEHIINDINLYNLLLKFFISIYNNEDKMIIETNMINALSYLIKNYVQGTKKYDFSFNNNEIINNSIYYIKDRLDSNISLNDLAINSNISKYHFLRVFKNSMGITPHQYILTQRIEKSKNLILEGMNISSAAYSTGFSDQSHLIRSFKKIYGYTPNDFKQNSNFVL